ncbi:HEAT repeat domain-containing protein [Actinomadura fibrosa]|uniref:HEAT repeat domain-containing protein n=1 Tax=Actinomadura fibrosa TaxID=111802 RepID=A0ABW2XU01_9ACTN|nr:HEAT repeat domain-containing protein [Actinomadura fibrosa]
MASADESGVAGLDARTCTAAELKDLLGHGDARVRAIALLHLADRLDAGLDEDPAGYAPCLPSVLEGPPEAALALARVFLRLRGHLGVWPRWREAGLPVRVRIAWLRAEIADRPSTVRDEPAGDLLYQAVRELRAVDVGDPEAFVRELAGRSDRVLRGEAFRIVRDALVGALLAPGRARTIIEDLAADVPEPLEELAAPWAALEPLPEERVRRFLAAGPAGAAIEVAGRHGHARLLREVAADPGRPPEVRRRALELLGGLATRDDIGDLLRVAGADPLLLAGPAVACLRGMHARGHFPADRDVPAVVGLALADHRVPAEEVAAVLFSSRHAMLREVTAAEDSLSWPRRLDLLVALHEQGAPGVDVGAAVTELAPGADDPAPFLRAIRALRYEPAEEVVLALLPRAPREALDALEAVGGARTAAVLRGELDGDSAAHLRPHRHRALELLWHLTADAAGRRALLERLDPRDLPPRIADDLGGPDAGELALLRAGLDPDDPVEALCRLARNGDASTVPVIGDLLLRVAAERPDVPDEALAAIRGLGARLFRRRAIRPRCLLDASDAEAAGNALLASLVLDLLDRPGLVAADRAALLGVLREVPYRRAKARVHPLLRDRDEQVRAQAIAVIGRDDGDARVMAASLVPLMASEDVRTVRQALLALGEAGVGQGAVAACLDHPNMNVKKTAAAVLARAGGPDAVPKLLYWLGHHDNPGLREALIGASRAVLGDAFAATVIAAADRADHRARDLLLRSLDGLLPARSIAALADQGSAAGGALLGLVADGLVAPAPGPVAELARHGITVPGRAPAPAADVEALIEHGWNAGIARRVVDAHERKPYAAPYGRLRPMLADFLGLAGVRATRFALRICPPPWTDAELDAFARSARTLIDALPDTDRLMEALREAVPRLGPAERLGLAEHVRGLPLGRDGLVILRLCDAVLTRADLDRALAAGRGPGEEDVLREAFGQEPVDAPAEPDWRDALRAAVRDARSLARLRAAAGGGGPSRDRLDALISVYPSAPATVRGPLIDWMLDLQPLDAPPWTLAEEARDPGTEARVPRPDDLDQPRSDAQRDRLLAMLGDASASRRDGAARVLRDWPEPAVRLALLRAYLDGRIGIAPDMTGLTDLPEDGERLARLAERLDPAELERFVPVLVSLWEEGGPSASAAGDALRRTAPDLVAEAVSARLADGAWGLLDLLAGRPLLRTPDLERARRRLLDEGRDDLADALVLVDGPLRAPDARLADEAALTALRQRPAPDPGPSRADLLRQAREGGPKEIRRALTALAEGPVDADLEDVLSALLVHPETKVRLHAHRVSRRVLDRPAYLEQTVRLLDDPEPDVVRSAVRALSHAGHRPAVPGLIALLSHAHRLVRQAAEEGLVLIGEPAVPALKHAVGRARPDRRHRYTGPLERIAAGRT